VNPPPRPGSGFTLVTPSTGYQFAQDAREVRVDAGEPPAYRVIRLLGSLFSTEVQPVSLPGGAAQATWPPSAVTGGKRADP
jgi:hypothetical protein